MFEKYPLIFYHRNCHTKWSLLLFVYLFAKIWKENVLLKGCDFLRTAKNIVVCKKGVLLLLLNVLIFIIYFGKWRRQNSGPAATFFPGPDLALDMPGKKSICKFSNNSFVFSTTCFIFLPGWSSSISSVSENRRTDLVVYRSDRSIWLAIMYMNCWGFVERLHSVWLVNISWFRNVIRQILLHGGLTKKWSGLTSVFRTSIDREGKNK